MRHAADAKAFRTAARLKTALSSGFYTAYGHLFAIPQKKGAISAVFMLQFLMPKQLFAKLWTYTVGSYGPAVFVYLGVAFPT